MQWKDPSVTVAVALFRLNWAQTHSSFTRSLVYKLVPYVCQMLAQVLQVLDYSLFQAVLIFFLVLR